MASVAPDVCSTVQAMKKGYVIAIPSAVPTDLQYTSCSMGTLTLECGNQVQNVLILVVNHSAPNLETQSKHSCTCAVKV